MSGNSSLLLWLMAFVVAFLGAYLFLGWVRRAQAVVPAAPGSDGRSGQVALAALSLGLAIPAAMVLALSAARLPFLVGYRWLWVAPLFIAPLLACLPVAWWLSRQQRWPALLGSALALAGVALAVQAGWVLAAGFRPGIGWQPLLLALSAGVAVLGFGAALGLANSDIGRDGSRRLLWRLAAAALMALTLVVGQEVLTAAGGVVSQIGSVYLREAPATWLSLVAGGIIPALLSLLALDLALRNRADRRSSRRRGGGGGGGSGSGTGTGTGTLTRSGSGLQLNLPPQRKRRRKYRAL